MALDSSESSNDTVAVGLLPDPFITSGPWAVHPYWDSLPPGSGVPIHDTPCKPVPARETHAAPKAASAFPFIANNRKGQPVASRLPRMVSTVLSVLLATVLAIAGLVAVQMAASRVGVGSAITVAPVLASAACGLLLIVASIIGQGGRR